jgi:hypothetical protein
LATGIQESGLRPRAVSPNGLWKSIFQQANPAEHSWRDAGAQHARIADAVRAAGDRDDDRGSPLRKM